LGAGPPRSAGRASCPPPPARGWTRALGALPLAAPPPPAAPAEPFNRPASPGAARAAGRERAARPGERAARAARTAATREPAPLCRRTGSLLRKSEWLQLLPHPAALLTAQLGLRLKTAALDLLRWVTGLSGSHSDKLRRIEESLQVGGAALALLARLAGAARRPFCLDELET
jgi:hypothetical protein